MVTGEKDADNPHDIDFIIPMRRAGDWYARSVFPRLRRAVSPFPEFVIFHNDLARRSKPTGGVTRGADAWSGTCLRR
jgi:hypothetical protein